MSFFDHIICEYKLPLPKISEEFKEEVGKTVWGELIFETVNFEGVGDTYTISEDGRIYKRLVENKFVKDKKSPSGFSLEKKDLGLERMEHTGAVEFYSAFLGEKKDFWFHYKALFWKGDLKEIEIQEYKEIDNFARLEVQGTMQREADSIIVRKSKWWYPIWSCIKKIFFSLFSVIKWLLIKLIECMLEIENYLKK